jgi:hypothetical protein
VEALPVLVTVLVAALWALLVAVLSVVKTLEDPYYKRVPLPRVPEYRNLSQDSQLTKPSVKFAAVEPNILSDYPNGYRKIFGRRRAPITPACE